ncbi:MAG: MarR family winged helix-turn-helix transcriptional regulator [Acidimicrobiia bacterium]
MDRTTRRADHVEALQRTLAMVVRRTVVPRVHERIVALAGVEIEQVEAVALSRLADAQGMRLGELAQQLRVDCSTASRHVSRLVERGLARREPDPLDARAVVLTATAAGQRLIRRLRAAHCQLLDERLATWSDDDLRALVGLTGRLVDDLAALTDGTEPALA